MFIIFIILYYYYTYHSYYELGILNDVLFKGKVPQSSVYYI